MWFKGVMIVRCISGSASRGVCELVKTGLETVILRYLQIVRYRVGT